MYSVLSWVLNSDRGLPDTRRTYSIQEGVKRLPENLISGRFYFISTFLISTGYS